MAAFPQGPELARVQSRQVPLFARDLPTICEELELSRREVTRLHKDGYLSFNPSLAGKLDESCEAEVRFLGSLVAAGCSRPMLKALLRDLEKPYCYDIRRVYYDWQGGQWRLLPGEDDIEGTFFSMLERLDERDARGELNTIREWLEEALDMEETSRLLLTHEHRELVRDDHPIKSRGDDASAAQ